MTEGLRVGVVRSSDIANHPIRRMDAEYWLNRQESVMRETDDQFRNRRAGELGYPYYAVAHDAIRQQIDDELDAERERQMKT